VDLRPPPPDDASSQRQLARLWLAWLDEHDAASTADSPTEGRSPRAIEMRLLQRALAHRRGMLASDAPSLAADPSVSPYGQALALGLEAHIARRAGRDTQAEAIDADIDDLLRRQHRRLYDPYARRWRGEVPPRAESLLLRIRAVAERIDAVRRQAQ